MRTLSIASAGGSLTLDGSNGVKAGLKVRGTGAPPVSLQWFEGAGDGAEYRGGRALPRVIDLPIRIYGSGRAQVQERLSQVSRIMALANAPVTLTINLDGERWRLMVVRTGGGDWNWGEDTDGSTFLSTVFTVQAGDPYWERENSSGREITPGGVGLPLLGPGVSLTELQLSNMEGLGAVTFSNVGDVETFPTWTIRGPFEGFTLARDGLVLQWVGSVAEGETITVDSRLGTVKGDGGVNLYGGLLPAPKFWTIPPGSSEAEVILDTPSGASSANVVWHPRRLAVF